MARLKALLLFSVLMVLAFSASGLAQRVDTGSGSLNGMVTTTSQTMVYAPFVSNIAIQAAAGASTAPIRIDTSMIVSNPLAVPNGLQTAFLAGGADIEGTLEFYCFNQDGALVFFETSMDPTIGNGLSDEGTLRPGESYTLLFRNLLAGVLGDEDARFDGYCWIVANFDGVAGSATVSAFSIGFSQTNAHYPTPGQGPTTSMGIPVEIP